MFRRILRAIVLTALALFMMVPGADNLNLNPAQVAALPYRYSIARWEAANLLSKWVHMVAQLSWIRNRGGESAAGVTEYFRLSEEISEARASLGALAAGVRPGSAAALEEELKQLEKQRGKLRNDTEEVLESAISSALLEVGLGSWGPMIFPPVDIRLTETPKLLVTSPRHKIERAYDVLLETGVSLSESRRMEDALREDWDLSALVVPIGGLATYPALVVGSRSLEWTLRVAAHEWVHNYLSFRFTPLGVNIHASPEMLSLNEMTADLVGSEIGGQAYDMIVPAAETEIDPPQGHGPVPEPESKPAFDFGVEMRKTRGRVDRLLEMGAVVEAEEYMEQRRKLFVANGYNIRKLNQAYFAFHGTYPTSPTSASPIGAQVQEFRSLMPDVGAFLITMSDFASYAEFVRALEAARHSDTTTEAGG